MSVEMRMKIQQRSPTLKLRIGNAMPHGGTTDYNDLSNKPSIEGHELVGDSTIQEIGVDALSVTEIEKILYLD